MNQNTGGRKGLTCLKKERKKSLLPLFTLIDKLTVNNSLL